MEEKKSIDQATVDYIYTYVATGCMGMIRKWLFDSDPAVREIAVLITQLANEAVARII